MRRTRCWPALAAAVTLGSLAGCPTPGVFPRLEPQEPSISVEARLDEAAPAALLRVQVSEPLKLRARATLRGVGAVSSTPFGPGEAAVRLDFRPPGELGLGTYDDALTLELCPDAACAPAPLTRQLPVSYRVLPGSPPILASLTPPWARAGQGGDAGLTLVVNGSRFGPRPVLRLDGQPRPTTLLSSEVLQASLPPTDLAVGRVVQVTVADGVGDATSAPLPFRVFGPDEPPRLVSLDPPVVDAEGPDLRLRAVAQGFERPARLEWNGSPLATLAQSEDAVVALVPAELLLDPGEAQVALRGGPGDAGLASPPLPVEVRALPAPAVTGLTPASAPVGSLPFTLLVQGTALGAGAQVLWNGVPLATDSLGPTAVSAEVPAAALARAGTVAVAVTGRRGPSAASPFLVARAPQDAVTVGLDVAHTGVAHVDGFQLPAAPRWRLDLGGTPSYPVLAEGLVLVTVTATDGGSSVLALEASTGAVRWGPVGLRGAASPAYGDGELLVVTGNAATIGFQLHAFQASSGERLWDTESGTWGRSFPPGLTVAHGSALVGRSDLDEVVFRAATGVAWDGFRATLSWFQRGMAPAVASSGDVAFTTSCDVVVFPPWGFYERWTLNRPGCATAGPGLVFAPWPVVAGGALYTQAASSGGEVLDLTSGHRLAPLPPGSAPAVDTSLLYLTTPQGLLAAYPLPLDGGPPLWTFATSDRLVTAPVAVNTTVFVGGGSRLFAVDALRGGEVWSVDLGAPLLAPHDGGSHSPLTALAAGHGLLVVPAGTTLTAFTLSSDP